MLFFNPSHRFTMAWKTALAAAIVLLISGCVSNDAPQVDCDKLVKSGERDQCIFNKSVSRLNVGGCVDIGDAKVKADCIDNVSVGVRDYLPCRTHDKMPARDRCEAKVADARKLMRQEESG